MEDYEREWGIEDIYREDHEREWAIEDDGDVRWWGEDDWLG